MTNETILKFNYPDSLIREYDHFHYHVIPRYSGPVRVDGRDYGDEHWPGPPDVTRTMDLSADALAAVQERTTAAWPA